MSVVVERKQSDSTWRSADDMLSASESSPPTSVENFCPQRRNAHSEPRSNSSPNSVHELPKLAGAGAGATG